MMEAHEVKGELGRPLYGWPLNAVTYVGLVKGQKPALFEQDVCDFRQCELAKPNTLGDSLRDGCRADSPLVEQTP